MTESDLSSGWFVAYVKYCHEKRVASMLESIGVEYYLPIQQVRHKWSDRVKIVDKMVLPRLIFVRTPLNKRIELLSEVPSLLGYMTEHGAHTPVVVPNKQLEVFRFMVENSDDNIMIETGPLIPGDHVMVSEGPLAGLECDLVQIDQRRCIAVGLGPIGNALIEVSLSQIQKIS